MNVTTPHTTADDPRDWVRRTWAGSGTAAGLAIVYLLDRSTGAAPVQHLYYLPIVLAGISIGYSGGLFAGVGAIALYHLANPKLLTLRYEELDVVQVGLFLVVGLLAAKLARDSRRLHTLAMTDDLTGLHSLRSFEARLVRLVMEAERIGSPLTLLVLDVDRLKSLNDAHGHLTGAAAVRTIGHLIRSRMPAETTACRYGGDEFVAVVPRCDRTRARRLAEDLRTAVRMLPPTLNGIAFPPGTLSISIGVVCASPCGTLKDPARAGQALFAEADRALYVAKAAGRDCVHLASAGPPALVEVSAGMNGHPPPRGQAAIRLSGL